MKCSTAFLAVDEEDPKGVKVWVNGAGAFPVGSPMQEVVNMDPKTVCVVGLGTMGSGIAQLVAQAGFPVMAVESSDEALRSGLRRIEEALERVLRKGKIGESEKTSALRNIEGGTDLTEAGRKAFLVIEAVYEDMAAKRSVFSHLDRVCPSETIFASNTSTLWITGIAAATRRPHRVVGTHFLYPAPAIPLVELIRGTETSEETTQQVAEFLKACGKDVILVSDSPGFAINRLFIPFINEAFFALQEGIASAEQIDRACKIGLAHPAGPLTAADAFGLDIILAVMRVLHRELGEKYRPAPLLVQMVQAGRLGRKTGKGVFQY
jgi:3-hydroxybutyryl-CoA dehydrogenase